MIMYRSLINILVIFLLLSVDNPLIDKKMAILILSAVLWKQGYKNELSILPTLIKISKLLKILNSKLKIIFNRLNISKVKKLESAIILKHKIRSDVEP